MSEGIERGHTYASSARLTLRFCFYAVFTRVADFKDIRLFSHTHTHTHIHSVHAQIERGTRKTSAARKHALENFGRALSVSVSRNVNKPLARRRANYITKGDAFFPLYVRDYLKNNAEIEPRLCSRASLFIARVLVFFERICCLSLPFFYACRPISFARSGENERERATSRWKTATLAIRSSVSQSVPRTNFRRFIDSKSGARNGKKCLSNGSSSHESAELAYII